MDKIDIASATCKITNKKNTGELRWKNGILEQKWAIEEIRPHPGVSYRWESIPVYMAGDE